MKDIKAIKAIKDKNREIFIDIKIYENLLRKTHYLSNEYYKLQDYILNLYHEQNNLALNGDGYIKIKFKSKLNKLF